MTASPTRCNSAPLNKIFSALRIAIAKFCFGAIFVSAISEIAAAASNGFAAHFI
jgi:hypothetical protein